MDISVLGIDLGNFLRASERTGDRTLTVALDGGELSFADFSLVRRKRRTLPDATLVTAAGEAIEPCARSSDRIDYRVPANGRLVLSWA